MHSSIFQMHIIFGTSCIVQKATFNYKNFILQEKYNIEKNEIKIQNTQIMIIELTQYILKIIGK